MLLSIWELLGSGTELEHHEHEIHKIPQLVPSEGLRALQRAKSTMLIDTTPVMRATLRLVTAAAISALMGEGADGDRHNPLTSSSCSTESN
jgi:hypothetical protein